MTTWYCAADVGHLNEVSDLRLEVDVQ